MHILVKPFATEPYSQAWYVLSATLYVYKIRLTPMCGKEIPGDKKTHTAAFVISPKRGSMEELNTVLPPQA